MKQKFEIIHKHYKKYYGTYISKGHVPSRVTLDGDGFWSYTDFEMIKELFGKIDIGKFSKIIDLGSGDGMVVMLASLWIDSVGVELDKKLFDDSIRIQKDILTELKKEKLRLKHAKLVNKNFLDVDLKEFDLIFLNPDNRLYEIETKLRAEMNATARLIVMNDLFLPLNLKLIETLNVKGMNFRLYKNC
ncbi:hypothetical protein HN587_07615 [Candidatus Woesearchaeota archaeon]|nr:hypothetical protein [Candidatus Woesearchaeota archaeon]